MPHRARPRTQRDAVLGEGSLGSRLRYAGYMSSPRSVGGAKSLGLAGLHIEEIP